MPLYVSLMYLHFIFLSIVQRRNLTLFLISVLITEEYVYIVIKSDELWWGTVAKMSFYVYKPSPTSHIFVASAL